MGVARWISQAEAHHADATALLDNINGHDPDEPWTRYCLAAAQVHAELATASGHAALAVRPPDPDASANVANALYGIERTLARAKALQPTWWQELDDVHGRPARRSHSLRRRARARLAEWVQAKHLERRRAARRRSGT